MKTIFSKPADIKNEWYVIDASGKTLGRVAAKAASVLRGKHKATYEPNTVCGDCIVIINAEKIEVTGKKHEDMKYRHYTGFIGGLREYSFDTLIGKIRQSLSEGQSLECFHTTDLDARFSET